MDRNGAEEARAVPAPHLRATNATVSGTVEARRGAARKRAGVSAKQGEVRCVRKGYLLKLGAGQARRRGVGPTADTSPLDHFSTMNILRLFCRPSQS